MEEVKTIQERTTLTAQEAAAYVGISYWLLLELRKQGKIPHVKVGGRLLFRVKALDEWMAKLEEESLKEEDPVPKKKAFEYKII